MKTFVVTKADYLRYLECPRMAWLWANHPELRADFKPSRLSDQGDQVELLARQLFPKGVLIQNIEQQAINETQSLIFQKAIPIFQATFASEKYLARVDILNWNPTIQGWELIEVKSSTSLKPKHIEDCAFQYQVLKETGITPKVIKLILVNNQYVYSSKDGLIPKGFLKIEPITDKVFDHLEKVKFKMNQLNIDLNKPTPPEVPTLKKTFEYPLPDAMNKKYWEGIPEYSIYDIGNIRANTLVKLNEKNILKIEDVPLADLSSKAMKKQVELTQSKSCFIDKESIKSELDSLTYPLYFLDYESVNPAIPLFDGTRPYEQIPFQYSLHIIERPGSEPVHKDFLYTDNGSPIDEMILNIKSDIGPQGSIIVWNASFEKRIHNFLADQKPAECEFFNALNNRIFDLMLIFKNHYIDYRFKGSASIKNVLPVLVPDLHYKDLEIQHGGMAIDGILDLVHGETVDQEELIRGLKAYCERDTLAMVEIFNCLKLLMKS